MQSHDEGSAEIRSAICNLLLLTMGLISAPMLCASLLRSLDTGWQPIFSFQTIMFILVWVTWTFRRHLSCEARAYFTITSLSMIAMFCLDKYGVTLAAGLWIPFAAVMGALLLGRRAGIFVLLTLLLLTTMLAISFTLGLPVPASAITETSTSPTQWALHIFSWFFLGGTMVMAIGHLNQYLSRSLKQSADKSTSLEQTQLEYLDLFENLIDVVYRTDLNGKIIRISPSCTDLGFSPEEMLGTVLTDYYVDPNKRSELLAELKNNQGTVTNFEAQLLAKNGGRVWISNSVRYWTDKTGTVKGLQGIAHNINTLKDADKALRRSQKMSALGLFSGGKAHDFNHVLSIILGNEEAVQTDAKTIKDIKHVKDLKVPIEERLKSIDSVASLSRRLLTFSRPGRLEPELWEIDPVIRNVEKILRRTFGGNITLSFRLGCRGAMVLVDENQLEASLLNLAINASDAMPDGGALIIQTKTFPSRLNDGEETESQQARDLICVTVQDPDKGMAERIAPQALEPFFTTKALGAGNGLGLSMVHQFVNENQGKLSIQSQLRHGTTAALTLTQTAVNVEPPPLNSKETSEPITSPVRILLVEDSASLLTLVQRQLQNENFEVLTASNGQEALELIHRDEKIDVIFSDIMLPGGISGFDICREARKLRRDFKVLLTTGYAQNTPNEIDAMTKAPILYKPFSRQDLVTRLAQVIADPTPSAREF